MTADHTTAWWNVQFHNKEEKYIVISSNSSLIYLLINSSDHSSITTSMLAPSIQDQCSRSTRFHKWRPGKKMLSPFPSHTPSSFSSLSLPNPATRYGECCYLPKVHFEQERMHFSTSDDKFCTNMLWQNYMILLWLFRVYNQKVLLVDMRVTSKDWGLGR